MEIIISQDQVLAYLERMTRSPDQKIITTELRQGDLFDRGHKLLYEIDDLDITSRFGELEEGRIPLKEVYEAFNGDQASVKANFRGHGVKKDGEIILPFSKAIEEGIGECVEGAILTHLFSQRGRRSFLITGWYCNEGESNESPHSYNIIIKDNVPVLVDSMNPIMDEHGRTERPYVTPILGIGHYFKLIVPEDMKLRREYSL